MNHPILCLNEIVLLIWQYTYIFFQKFGLFVTIAFFIRFFFLAVCLSYNRVIFDEADFFTDCQ